MFIVGQSVIFCRVVTQAERQTTTQEDGKAQCGSQFREWVSLDISRSGRGSLGEMNQTVVLSLFRGMEVKEVGFQE